MSYNLFQGAALLQQRCMGHCHLSHHLCLVESGAARCRAASAPAVLLSSTDSPDCMPSLQSIWCAEAAVNALLLGPARLPNMLLTSACWADDLHRRPCDPSAGPAGSLARGKKGSVILFLNPPPACYRTCLACWPPQTALWPACKTRWPPDALTVHNYGHSVCLSAMMQDMAGLLAFTDCPVAHVRDQLAAWRAVKMADEEGPDPRVDVCLYFMSPEGLRAQDVEMMAQLSRWTSVVPIIARVTGCA